MRLHSSFVSYLQSAVQGGGLYMNNSVGKPLNDAKTFALL